MSSANRERLNLSFQEVQELSALQAALRFLPNVIIGIVLNLGTGLLVHRLHANYLVLVTTVLSAGSPLLLAIIDPNWSWWYCAFWAVLLGPLSADGNHSRNSTSEVLANFLSDFHGRQPDYCRFVQCKDAGSRWCRVQHHRAVRHVHWIDSFRYYLG